MRNDVNKPKELVEFLKDVLPEEIPATEKHPVPYSREAYIGDVLLGIQKSRMAVRLTPHILSCIDWNNPLEDQVLRQFIPLASDYIPDHPQLTDDSLDEKKDSTVDGLVHRYPNKVLFLGKFLSPSFS
jgi:lysine 2,3-aminomutase